MSESIRVRMKLHHVAGSYFIRSVDADDEGRYICVVSNSLGKKELPVNVTVLGTQLIDTASVSLFSAADDVVCVKKLLSVSCVLTDAVSAVINTGY